MSCVIVMTVALPTAGPALIGLISAAVAAAGASLGLTLIEGTEDAEAASTAVDLCVNNIEEVASGMSPGQKTAFRGDGVKVTFYLDELGRGAVRVEGSRSEAELRELGETMAKRVVQQYAYHRLVGEMRERNMNIVEEEVEADGTVRMLVRVHQG